MDVGELLNRLLPVLATAYPRKSKLGRDPEHGLASVEALHAAMSILEGPRPELLARYLWARSFRDALKRASRRHHAAAEVAIQEARYPVHRVRSLP